MDFHPHLLSDRFSQSDRRDDGLGLGISELAARSPADHWPRGGRSGSRKRPAPRDCQTRALQAGDRGGRARPVAAPEGRRTGARCQRSPRGVGPLTADVLPFESSFFGWLNERGMRCDRCSFPVPGASGSTTGYFLAPERPARQKVLALHGAGNDALFAWIGLFKALLLARTEIFTFDLPGHGRWSDTVFTPDAASGSVRAAVSILMQEGATLPLHAIGVSLGGSVLLRTLVELQDSFASAALVVAPLQIELSPSSIVREVGPRSFAMLWREREHYGLTGLIPSFGSFKREVYPLRLAERPPSGTFGYVAALNDALDRMCLEEAATRVQLPVLLVYGSDDCIVPIEQGEMLDSLLPRSELLRIRNGTHLSTPLERETMGRLIQWVGERR
ncbi:MAG: alpha/beta fold hydrolase [Gemmatimonas sp.]|nr:alpha/beta fold hydrolase [Gemmatimonas sp.]